MKTYLQSSRALRLFWPCVGVLLLLASPLRLARAEGTTNGFAITTSALSGMVTGVPYAQTIAVTGGTPPYAFSLGYGALPPGITVDSSGVVAGIPTKAGNYSAGIRATDSAALAAQRGYSIAVAQGTGGGSSSPTPTPSATVSNKNTLTVNYGTGSGSYTPWTNVPITANAAPAGQVFKQWIGAPVANAFAPSTTIQLSASLTVTATYYTPAPVPFPVTSHPRLWLTPSDLPKLQGWATASNQIYQQGLMPQLNAAISSYDTKFFPGGVANSTYPDFGDTQGYTGLLSEQYAMLFAFHSLIDPSPSARILHAQRARNLLMYAMNEAAKGQAVNVPFRDPNFAVYNRANFTSEAWPLTVDWIYNAVDAQGNPILTAQDKATIRTVFLRWTSECLNASTTGGDHPAPVGVTNSPFLLPNGNAYRMAANNYYLGHGRLVTLMSLVFDPADDQPINPTIPSAVQGNTLRSYITDATGAWLYQEFAMFGDASVVKTSYNLAPNSSVGLASGGLPPEGMLYGHSYSYILGELLALQTSGFNNVSYTGPQAALIGAPVWDRFVKGMIASLTPGAKVPASQPWLGPVYQMMSYGDLLRLWITPDFMQPFALLGLLDQQTGDNSRLAAERWFVTNAVEGGASSLLKHVATPWAFQESILYFLLLDPTAAAASDPRPTYPLAFYDAPQGRLVEHTDWTPNATMFDFRSSWISINHQQADGNQFEFYRKGEWLTKEVSNYDNNIYGLTSPYHNTLSLKNWCANGTPTNLGWWESLFWTSGSQWQLGGNAGDPTVTTSVQTDYTYAFGDTTKLYNRPSIWTPANAATDIQHASRSIIWLKPDHIVVYDRATSKTTGLFKRFNLALTGTPSLAGNVITSTTPSGQHLYISSLLPAVSSISTVPVGPELNPIAQLEPSHYRITVEDLTAPTDIRFLHVLQGADANVMAAEPTALVPTDSGTPFDGALLPNNVVMFKRDMSAVFTGVTYTVPVGTTMHYITGLAANAGYTAASQVVGTNLQVTITLGGSFNTDSAGVLELTF